MSDSASAPGNRVAIIGPLDDTASLVAEFVGQFDLEPLILPPANGQGLADRLDGLRDAGFALVVLSNDDSGALVPDTLVQLGFLLGTLGRARICLVLAGDAQAPDALDGLAKHAMDDNGLWRLLLAREMKRAGFEIDLNRAL